MVTLPPGTIIPGKLGSYDASFYQIYVSASSVKAWDDDPSNYSVAIPKANKNGEPKQVLLSRQEGHWENPEAEGPERGQYIVDSEKTMRLRALSPGHASSQLPGGSSGQRGEGLRMRA